MRPGAKICIECGGPASRESKKGRCTYCVRESGRAGLAKARIEYENARQGSDALLRRYLEYFAKYHRRAA